MSFSFLKQYNLSTTLETSGLTDRNFFRLVPISQPVYSDSRINTSKFELLQINESGEVYETRLLKYESYPQLVYLPLPKDWIQQKIGLRLASEVYPSWALSLSVDSELTTLPTGLDEIALKDITEIIRTQSPSADLNQSLFFRLDLSGAFKNVAAKDSLDALHIKLDALMGQHNDSGFDYVKFIQEKYNGS